jgi:EAL domain-containing protein (putative c-di-GMP-specific phosphodiesterase class I)
VTTDQRAPSRDVPVAFGIRPARGFWRLTRLGYSLGPGYHLARPMPAADLTRLLAAQRDLAATAVASR